MGSASGTVAARYNLRGSSEIVPSLSVRLMACWRPLAPVASTWPSEPQAPSQNGAQAANGRKIANRLSLTLAARRFARLDTGWKSLPQRPLPPRTNFRAGHPSGAKAQSHHSNILVAEPGKSQISNPCRPKAIMARRPGRITELYHQAGRYIQIKKAMPRRRETLASPE